MVALVARGDFWVDEEEAGLSLSPSPLVLPSSSSLSAPCRETVRLINA